MTALRPSSRLLANAISDPRQFLQSLYQAAVQRALPLHNTAAYLPKPPKGRTLVLGAGKAGGAMAQAVEALWPVDAHGQRRGSGLEGDGCEEAAQGRLE